MKNIIIILLVAIFATSCKREDIPYIFGASPEERVAAVLSELQTALLSSPYGWKAALNTSVGGGYGFYVDFNEDQTLTMLSDFSTATSGTLKASTYRTTWTMNATLMFDTYNYITLLQDPTPSVNGGTAGNGLRSDVEFELRKIGKDTILLQGLRYKNVFTLVKLTQNEQASYLNNGLTTSISDIMTYFATHANNYVNIEGIENKVEFVTTSTKGVVFQYVGNDGEVASATGKFNYELGGINFNEPIEINSVIFVRGVLEDGDFYLVTDRGQKHRLQQHTQPIMPIATLFGYNKTYNAIFNSTALPLGVTSDFTATFNQSAALFAAMNPARHIIRCYFRLTGAAKAELGIQNRVSPEGTQYATGLATFDYELSEDGVITLSNPVYDSNFSARVGQLAPIRDFFVNRPAPFKFKLIYVSSTDPSVSNIAGLQVIDQPTNFFYGSLNKM